MTSAHPQPPWPVEHLLDELWLRSRRLVAERMDAAGLWPAPKVQRKVMRGQWMRGEVLERQILLPALGAADFAWVHSDAAFGGRGARLGRSLPYVLAFGYELGGTLQTGRGDGGIVGDEWPRLCGLLNVGVTLLDRLVDGSKIGPGVLQSIVDVRVLAALASDSGEVARLRLASARSQPDARVVTRLIVAFFAALHHLAGSRRHSAEWSALVSLMVMAYGCELDSARQTGASSLNAPGEADPGQRSSFPFLIMGALSRLAAVPGAPAPIDEAALRHLAAAVTAIDDLADLAADYRSGDANGILRAAGIGTGGEAPRRLHELLNSGAIEAAADSITFSLQAVGRSWDGRRPQPDSPWTALQLICAYMRAWLE